jgi:hypothetical protein
MSRELVAVLSGSVENTLGTTTLEYYRYTILLGTVVLKWTLVKLDMNV